jgi:hypothetical protein
MVIDCTASDAVLHHIEVFPWDGPKLFVSVSIGYKARRLFLFIHKGVNFSRAAFYEMIGPWLIKERQDMNGEEMPWEGTGCWSPVFPAGPGDIWLMASVASKRLEEAVEQASDEAELRVFEQVYEGNTFVGLRRSLLDGVPH